MSQTATERLRKLLDERGVEWKHGDAAFEIVLWSTPDGRHCSAMYWKPALSVLISGCTPEQAIAATLGNGTLTAEQVRELIAPHLHARPTFDFGRHGAVWSADFQAIADELNATLGQGTCIPHGEWERLSQTQEFRRMYCDCGYELGMDSRDSFPFARTAYAAMPRFCPECGARIVSKGKAVER